MKKLQLYLETSVWNFYNAEDAPEKCGITIQFFERLKEKSYDPYISDAVLFEINNAEDPRKNELLGLIKEVSPTLLEVNSEIEALAEHYITKGVIPENKKLDATHIACATVHQLDSVISWNMRHIANLRRQEYIQAINLTAGYIKPLLLITPMEVSSDE